MTGPRLVISIGVEERPVIREEAMNEGESRRLEDWIKSRPELHRLVYSALVLTRKAA